MNERHPERLPRFLQNRLGHTVVGAALGFGTGYGLAELNNLVLSPDILHSPNNMPPLLIATLGSAALGVALNRVKYESESPGSNTTP